MRHNNSLAYQFKFIFQKAHLNWNEHIKTFTSYKFSRIEVEIFELIWVSRWVFEAIDE